jgi:hypothetical protein
MMARYLQSQIAASIRISAIGQFLRVCGVNSDCDERNEQNGPEAIVRFPSRTPHPRHNVPAQPEAQRPVRLARRASKENAAPDRWRRGGMPSPPGRRSHTESRVASRAILYTLVPSQEPITGTLISFPNRSQPYRCQPLHDYRNPRDHDIEMHGNLGSERLFT